MIKAHQVVPRLRVLCTNALVQFNFRFLQNAKLLKSPTLGFNEQCLGREEGGEIWRHLLVVDNQEELESGPQLSVLDQGGGFTRTYLSNTHTHTHTGVSMQVSIIRGVRTLQF